jgi:hypothetical protein
MIPVPSISPTLHCSWRLDQPVVYPPSQNIALKPRRQLLAGIVALRDQVPVVEEFTYA